MAAIELKVERVEAAAEAIRSIVLVSADGGALPAYAPGAHVEIHLPDGATRPYSLIDFDGDFEAPRAYRFGVRLEQDGRGGSRFMHGLEEGATVRVEMPKNDFPLADETAPSILIAGGIGITPMISMATALKRAGRDYCLHYAVRNRAAAAFADTLEAAHGDLLRMHFDDAAGRPMDLRGVLADADGAAHLYVCGPQADDRGRQGCGRVRRNFARPGAFRAFRRAGRPGR